MKEISLPSGKCDSKDWRAAHTGLKCETNLALANTPSSPFGGRFPNVYHSAGNGGLLMCVCASQDKYRLNTGVLDLRDLMPDDLRWIWCNKNRNKIHCKCNECSGFIEKPSPSLWSLERLSCTELVPGVKKGWETTALKYLRERRLIFDLIKAVINQDNQN